MTYCDKIDQINLKNHEEVDKLNAALIKIIVKIIVKTSLELKDAAITYDKNLHDLYLQGYVNGLKRACNIINEIVGEQYDE